MRELLVATRNSGKIEEFKDFLKDAPFAVRSVAEIAALEGFEPEETGSTFAENALIKAREYGKKAGILTIADDSGMEVDALGGEPGVRSARYVEGSDADRYRAVLTKMKDVPLERRGARFVSVIALYDAESGREATTKGTCSGHIVLEPKGERGFGYDPIFFSDELAKTFAAASLEEKRTGDHRGKALTKMRDILLAEFA